MKSILTPMAIFILTTSSFSYAASVNHCKAYENKERYLKAITVVAKNYDMTLQELCQSERFLGIEAQPSRKINREGDVIPHVSVQLHMYSSSCLFMIRDSDLSVTEGRCYSGE